MSEILKKKFKREIFYIAPKVSEKKSQGDKGFILREKSVIKPRFINEDFDF